MVLFHTSYSRFQTGEILGFFCVGFRFDIFLELGGFSVGLS